MTAIRLPLPDYAWRFDLLLDFARRIPYPARMVASADALWRFTGGALMSYRRDGAALLIEAHDTSLDAELLLRRSRWVLGMDSDLSAFYAFAKTDERLWQVIAPVCGMPLIRAESVFEALISLIIEQHISWRFASRAQQVLLKLAGDCAKAGGMTVCDFPSPRQIDRCDRETLRPLKITNRRIDLILRLARDACAGDLDLEALSRIAPEDAYVRLLEIKGVGHWTAANVIGRAFGVYPYASHNDVALQAAVNLYFWQGRGEKGAAQTRDTLDGYGEYAGLVGHLTLLRWVLERYPPTIDG